MARLSVTRVKRSPFRARPTRGKPSKRVIRIRAERKRRFKRDRFASVRSSRRLFVRVKKR